MTREEEDLPGLHPGLSINFNKKPRGPLPPYIRESWAPLRRTPHTQFERQHEMEAGRGA